MRKEADKKSKKSHLGDIFRFTAFKRI